MNYIVNDIEDIIILNRIGLFKIILSKCNSISLTNMKIDDFSYLLTYDISLLKENGIKIIEVDIEMFFFRKKNSLFSFGKGDVSSMYQAYSDKSCLLTSNKRIHEACKLLDIDVLFIDDFIQSIFGDNDDAIRINNLKIIYKNKLKDVI